MKKTRNILGILFLILTLGLHFIYVSLPEYGEHVLGYYICSNGMLFIACCILLLCSTVCIIKKMNKTLQSRELTTERTIHFKKIIGAYIVTATGIGLIIFGIVKVAFYYIAINADVKVVVTFFVYLLSSLFF